MKQRLDNYLHALHPVREYRFSRPLVVFQSDDWGLLGIRDKEGFDKIAARGPAKPEHPYLADYGAETPEDLSALYSVLGSHRDSIGRPSVFVFNFVMTNVDFERVKKDAFKALHLKPISEGLPRPWEQSKVLHSYLKGMESGLLYPALHGLTHFNAASVEALLQEDTPRGEIMRELFEIGTPYSYDLTPWVGYEFKVHPEGPVGGRWLSYAGQREAIKSAALLFKQAFGFSPATACAPGYRANADTYRAWAAEGILVAQSGPGHDSPPFIARHGLLYLHRNVELEPAISPELSNVKGAVDKAVQCVQAGLPVIVSTHSVNYHSSLKNFRDLTLKKLDEFLTLLEQTLDGLLYVHDRDLLDIVKTGVFKANGKEIKVQTESRRALSPLLKKAVTNKLSRTGKT